MRTAAEFANWHIPEAINIPYTELRAPARRAANDARCTATAGPASAATSPTASCDSGFADSAFLSGGVITFHGFHRTPLEVGQGGFPIVAHAEDEMATRPGALEHI